MSEITRSYDAHRHPGGFDAEVSRLETQAALAWREEAHILRDLGLTDDATVVEVGCGAGAFLSRLRELVPTGLLFGIEPNEELAAIARSRAPSADIIAGTAEQIPLSDSTVDVVVARFVLQHVRDPGVALQEFRRVLRRGGLAAAIEVDGQLWGLSEPSFPEVAKIYAKIWLSQRGRGGDRMIGRRLPRLLRAAGFDKVVLRLYGYSSYEHGLDAFAVHLDPDGLTPFVEDGTISVSEHETLRDAYRRFLADPNAFVLLAGLVAAGRRP